MANSAEDVSGLLDKLAEHSSRPRYAFLVLNLLAETADQQGRVGPYVVDKDAERLTVREYIGKRMARISSRDRRRQQLEQKVRQELAGQLPDDLFEAQQMIDQLVDERIRASGADNFSRVVSELEKCGLLRRFYQGYRTNHENRGGLRNLVCVVDGDAVAALRRRDRLV